LLLILKDVNSFFLLVTSKVVMSESVLATFKEYLELIAVNLKVKFVNLVDYLKVVVNYYSNPFFLKIDSYLMLSYLFNNPFGVSKQFLLNKGAKDIYTYGETPLATLDYIAQECCLSTKDTVFELGCGRGRTCFWLNQFIGCSVIGIDYVPQFIERANRVKAKFNVKGVEFRLEDLLKSDLTSATVIYLYGTCFSASFIQVLIKRFASLPPGTKIITVSYALAHYAPDSGFEVLKRFSAPFTWGAADVYLQVKK
jgi:SAM-dependent methyltransferase